MGVVLPLALAPWFLMASCSLDWTVPPPSRGDGGIGPELDAGADHVVTGDGPDDAVVPDAIEDVVEEMPGADATEGGPLPCEQQPDCSGCVDCVLVELQEVGTSASCLLYTGCVINCGTDLSCQQNCTELFPAGYQILLALNERCVAQCGLPAPCSPPG